MTQTRKPLTVPKLHAVLKKAGFNSSKKQATRIRGWNRLTKGYELYDQSSDLGNFHITHINDSHGYGSKSDPVEMVAKYRTAIEAAGLNVVIETPNDTEIIVRELR